MIHMGRLELRASHYLLQRNLFEVACNDSASEFVGDGPEGNLEKNSLPLESVKILTGFWLLDWCGVE